MHAPFDRKVRRRGVVAVVLHDHAVVAARRLDALLGVAEEDVLHRLGRSGAAGVHVDVEAALIGQLVSVRDLLSRRCEYVEVEIVARVPHERDCDVADASALALQPRRHLVGHVAVHRLPLPLHLLQRRLGQGYVARREQQQRLILAEVASDQVLQLLGRSGKWRAAGLAVAIARSAVAVARVASAGHLEARFGEDAVERRHDIGEGGDVNLLSVERAVGAGEQQPWRGGAHRSVACTLSTFMTRRPGHVEASALGFDFAVVSATDAAVAIAGSILAVCVAVVIVEPQLRMHRGRHEHRCRPAELAAVIRGNERSAIMCTHVRAQLPQRRAHGRLLQLQVERLELIQRVVRTARRLALALRRAFPACLWRR
mmetsp:Transcript_54596/g.119078  ORF Transcript_54596/g.119078 Transcript_54596/m.119078 type:complete len:371 (-) Transcript_54596:1645-2757(-)